MIFMTNRHETDLVNEDTLKKKRGRPKCFDEQQVLEKAMLLFWEHGYEATSISDLTHALEITAPSLYSAFGDKAGLFYKSIDYYLAHEACPIETIFLEAKSAKIAFELYLYDNVKRLVQPNKPAGCMLVVAAMNCSDATQEVQQNLLDKRIKTKEKLLKRLEQGVEQGDLPINAPLQEMTDFYATVIQGLTIQARDGASTEQLHKVVEHAMKAWTLF
ncbi:TPA: TetR/AcrR family transcriptional regulator [Acinetobacter baumannii]|uniref:TetR/AcrR family transcriptional regulator n=1 Tax=Acinetobacter baumannii TaxID=470 RepID=UPI000A345ABF|nr:TetR/AcrR family transcriptional regulator [Acinetobacter baumannii]HCA5338424.1 TetR/AcrR family transcriptional regulator [Acinetobacter baumannii]HCA5339458.1 TetR/AcrR family transcriptional regulator [Acinetobacter baumannii]